MRRCIDPLSLDPFSPIGIGPIGSSTTEPLALEPLSSPSAGARPIDARVDRTRFADWLSQPTPA
jgi:hypothetical protein